MKPDEAGEGEGGRPRRERCEGVKGMSDMVSCFAR